MKEFIIAAFNHKGQTVKVYFINSTSKDRAIEAVNFNRFIKGFSTSYYQVL
jgi:hypothetical protein